ncbi:MAG TPA: hypothetical protein VGA22_13685, partial [Gemmatimonadales bacterium]
MSSHRYAVGLALAGTLLAVGCLDDVGGPGPGIRGYFSITPSFQSSAASIVPLGSARLVIRRASDQVVVTDVTLPINPADSTIDFSVEVVMLSSGENFILTVQLFTPSNQLVWTSGPVTVTPSTDPNAAPVVSVDFSYAGTGSNAASVVILHADTGGVVGDSLDLAAEARDSAGQAIPGTPIGWLSLDPSVATTVDDSSGKVKAVGPGTARIVAELLTGQRDTLRWSIQGAPARIVVLAGDAQTAVAGTALPDTVVVQ